MNINEIKQSKFLKKEDCEPAILVTIRGIEQENVALESQPEDLKYVIFFKELEKGMVLHSTNAQLIAKALGSDETDDWTNKKIVLFNDPSVSYVGKVTGGIRARKYNPKPAAKAATTDMDEMEDDIPF